LTLNSLAQAMQGNIATANDSVKRAVDAEFGDSEAQLNFLQQAYNMNKDVINRQDTKAGQKIELQLKERERLLTEQKNNKTLILGFANDAVQQGADNATAMKMTQAKTPEEALAIGSKFLGAKFKQDREQQIFENKLNQAKLDNDTKLTAAQIANYNSQITDRANNNKLTTLPTVASLNLPGLTSDQKNSYVLNTLFGSGKLPAGAQTVVATTNGAVMALRDMVTNT
jgi:hypothetical protein